MYAEEISVSCCASDNKDRIAKLLDISSYISEKYKYSRSEVTLRKVTSNSKSRLLLPVRRRLVAALKTKGDFWFAFDSRSICSLFQMKPGDKLELLAELFGGRNVISGKFVIGRCEAKCSLRVDDRLTKVGLTIEK